MDELWNAIARRGSFIPWLHMLRGMQLSGGAYPFASVDSTDIAQNHHRFAKFTAIDGRPLGRSSVSRPLGYRPRTDGACRMIGRILCLVGLHRWDEIGDYLYIVSERCRRCPKKRLRVVS